MVRELLGVFSEQRYDEQRQSDDRFLWYDDAEDRLCEYGEAADDTRDGGLPILHDTTDPDCDKMRRKLSDENRRRFHL